MLTFEQIKELIELVAHRKLQGLEVERSGFRLKIDGDRASAPAPAPPVLAAAAGPAPAAVQPVAPAAAPPVEEPDDEDDGLPPNAHIIKSPIVGTFYRSPAPDADPFTDIGSRIKKGQVLCIVEAMKLMNEIEAEVDGTVLEIYAEDSEPVEFGEPLFAIKPA